MKPATMKEAEAHAIAEFPKESCGLVVVVGRKEQYYPCRNIADDPEKDFAIDGRDFYTAEELGKITMVVHSHPNANALPTEHDKLACERSMFPWCILAVHGDPAYPDAPPKIKGNHQFAPTGYKAPLVSREFIFGTQDCFTLVKDFYERELGIVMPDPERTDKFWERGEDLYMENFKKWGFYQIPEPSERGDVILMAVKSDITNHAGIWLAERDHMLHHPYEHLSERTVYGGYWAECTRIFVRRKK